MPDGRLTRTRDAYKVCAMCLVDDCRCPCDTCERARGYRALRRESVQRENIFAAPEMWSDTIQTDGDWYLR